MSNIIKRIGKMLKRHVNARCALASTDRSAMEYNMNHKHRGQALIFYHQNFEHTEATISTKQDCEDLRDALNKLGFVVSSYYDYRWSEIKKSIKEAAEKDHSQNDCIVIAILTYGDSDFLWAHDEQYKLDSICQFFLANKCPTLAGKPKLFFIEAPRGEMLDSGITMRRTETDGVGTFHLSYTIPTHADFLLFHSTIPGFQSFQNSLRGSWFIQSLVAELNKNGKSRDLNTLLTFVNRRVGIEYQSENPFDSKKDQKKQIPCITTMLTRIVRFNDKIQQN